MVSHPCCHDNNHHRCVIIIILSVFNTFKLSRNAGILMVQGLECYIGELPGFGFESTLCQCLWNLIPWADVSQGYVQHVTSFEAK